jgi:hypothetical protein
LKNLKLDQKIRGKSGFENRTKESRLVEKWRPNLFNDNVIQHPIKKKVIPVQAVEALRVAGG